jgi:hypothetical protein
MRTTPGFWIPAERPGAMGSPGRGADADVRGTLR